ncbi:MAG: hypothetical protein H7A34_04540 [bacterium]|nr:hypothetical protein [bacterium]
MPLIEPSLLDTAVQEYGRKGASYGTRFPGERILVIPTHDLHAKITSCKYSKERKTKEEIEKVRETAVSLANLKNEKSIEEISQQQIINLKKRSGNPLSCDDILSHMHETGYVHHVRAAEAYQFYPVHRQTDAEFIKHILSFRKDVTFDNRIAIQKLIDEKTRPLAPVTIEVELTSRTNTKVSVPPFTLMKHYECDLSIEQYRTIINTFSNDLLYLVLDGFGEPTLHPNLLECIKYAKEQLCFRVCLKTNGYFLNTDMMSKLIQSPLDILIIDVDEYDALSRPLETTDSSYPSEKLILSILEIRAKFNKETPYILLQCMNSMSNQINVQYYYNRWARIVDAVVIQPHNDYLPVPSSDELIDLSPTGQHINCFKTTQTLLILANGKPVLCKQKPDGFQPSKESDLHSIWLDNYLQGGTFDFCQQCIHKFYREGMQPDRFISSLHFAIQNTAYSILPDKLFSECTQNDTAKKQKLLEEIMQFYPDHPKIQEIIASLVTTK